ncbi:ABC transporter permease [Pseudoalteromonas sp. T1lg24]|uniref:ABC transporter permease n=1 Tax=Pseudoalteromonas sp. T1lg24 TaxID=2077099 RepID=UPI000CF5E3E2|nr:ABC transporter permease [Pseudoalteromonas sp. T1lg24]
MQWLDEVRGGYALFKRDLATQNKVSKLNLLLEWMESIMLAIIFFVLYSFKGILVEQAEFSYGFFIISGILVWHLIIDAINTPASEFNKLRNLLSHVNISPFSFIIFIVLKLNFHALFRVAVIIIYALFVEDISLVSSIIFFVFCLALCLFFGGLGLFVLPFNVINRDVSKVINLCLKPLMFVSGVLFPISSASSSYFSEIIVTYNPFYIVVNTSRNILLNFNIDLQSLSIIFLILSIFTGVAVYAFTKTQSFLVEKL